tara:strand:- start:421 stop:1512 length:1092 start_codon:yes stop_codon:yes gene_type:complete
MQKQKIIISCGGTGGHIFPALEIAKSLKSQNQNLEVLFVGALGKMEMITVPKNGFSIIGLWIQGIYRNSIFKNLLLPLKLFISVLHAFYIIIVHRPSAVIGTGGFASGPMLFVASFFNFNTYIQEQNSYAGLTNKLLSKWVSKIFVSHVGMDKFFPKSKIINFGNPVRVELNNPKKNQLDALRFFSLQEHKVTVLVVGGSLGAEPINQSICKNLEFLKHKNVQFIWQTGSLHYLKYMNLQSSTCVIYKFIDRMDMAYLAADIVISRAGAIAISEICFLSKASILIPSPHVTDDHQTINAKYLLDNNACLMVHEKNIDKHIIENIIKLKDDEIREDMGRKAKSLFQYNASNDIARFILKDIDKY